MRPEEEYQSGFNHLFSWQGGWESINGNPDVYIFRDYDGSYYLLTYSYDRDYGRGNFSCHRIESDENSCYICMGTKHYRLTEEKYPYGLCIGDWGSYMKN
ncbi:MAG: DUF3876 domain-containing protein [Bacteroidales bacterium]|jgi:hypothetical protein|nr:DUF3876 domain-containing protein [Bacteroidales bacterium]